MRIATNIFAFTICAFLVASCSVSKSANTLPVNNSNNQEPSDIPIQSTPSSTRDAERDLNVGVTSRKNRIAGCYATETGDKFVLKNQTFPIDFKPFENSCFVTAYDPEFEDPPLGSEIAIFKDGKRVYKFESRYNPEAATCWVEAVGFKDLTADDLIDIIVLGKCGAKSGPVQGNEVFINTGDGFYTNVSSNDKLENFNTIKDITNFVRQNKKLFSE